MLDLSGGCSNVIQDFFNSGHFVPFLGPWTVNFGPFWAFFHIWRAKSGWKRQKFKKSRITFEQPPERSNILKNYVSSSKNLEFYRLLRYLRFKLAGTSFFSSNRRNWVKTLNFFKNLHFHLKKLCFTARALWNTSLGQKWDTNDPFRPNKGILKTFLARKY